MTANKNITKINQAVISLAIFLLALLPRAYALRQFVTADESKWVYRSAQFLAAFLQADFVSTSVNLTPAVTTTWLGSLGLALYYRFNQAAIGLPLTDWLLSLPKFRVELDILAATRWPMVIFTSLGVVAIYHLSRRLFNPNLAFIAAVFIALDPHITSLSRILGHDAPAATFTSLSLLLFLLAVNPNCSSRHQILYLITSGAMAGLAFLSKAPTLFLIPFYGLIILTKLWLDNSTLYHWVKRFLLWSISAYLIFTILWPAAWLDPVGRPVAVVENAFLSATDRAEAKTDGYWLVPDLGYAYYLVNGGFKLSPLVMVGLALALIPIFRKRNSHTEQIPTSILWLLAFVILFTIFMTMGEKRSPRYILPIFPSLALIAAYGWLQLLQLYKLTTSYNTKIFAAILTISAALILLPYSPYYFSYYNPLLGGAYTAPNLVKIGWGEGLDVAGRFLTSGSRVGTAYASTVAPFFKGNISKVTGDRLDYIILYRKQIQSGRPSPAFIRYFEQTPPIFSVEINGINYANIYTGTAVQPSFALKPGLDSPIMPKPIGFRPFTPYGRIGEQLEIDIIWLANDSLPTVPSIVTLEPLSAFDFSHDGHNHAPVPEQGETTIFAEGEGRLIRLADDLVVSRHRLTLPINLPRSLYALKVDGRPLGEIEARNFQIPSNVGEIDNMIFGDQIKLAGYQFEPTPDYISLTLVWQAQKSSLPAYTVFTQLLNAETDERIAGLDSQPLKGEWPTSQWVKGEIIIDQYYIAIPPDIQPGLYKVIAGFYLPETGQRLSVPNGQDYWTLPWDFIRK